MVSDAGARMRDVYACDNTDIRHQVKFQITKYTGTNDATVTFANSEIISGRKFLQGLSLSIYKYIDVHYPDGVWGVSATEMATQFDAPNKTNWAYSGED